MFTGEYWAGQRALELGLVDAIGDLRAVLRERFGDKVVTPLIGAERGWLGRRVPGVGLGRGELPQIGAGFATGLGFGTGLAEDLISALEARALWARYGL